MLENPFVSRKYLRDVGVLRSYAGKTYKVTHLRCCRASGIECEEDRTYTPKGVMNMAKLSNNISRARARVYELAYCNEWDLFVTFTLDKSKYDRHDLPKFSRDFGQFVRDSRKRYGCDISYLLIPERHKDGAWHMHGFMAGVPQERLRAFTLRDKLPNRIRARLRAGVPVFTWEDYAGRFGFSNIERVQSHEAVSKYITKYVTEDLARSVTELGAHTFYASQGLRHSDVIYRDFLLRPLSFPDYKNDYVAVKNFSNLDDARGAFSNVAPYATDVI